jgi:chromosome segregation ATPase
MQQCMHLTAYDERNTTISHKLEQLKHENTLLHSGTLSPLDQDHELRVAYRRLSEAEHRWNYTRQQLDIAREEVDSHTHVIIHLEDANEQQELELKERAAVIASLEQQLLAPLTPIDPTEPEVVPDVDEELVTGRGRMRGW